MSVLPGQKLTIGELFVSMAVGLILYLVPNDVRNQYNDIYTAEAMVLCATAVVVLVFFLIIKRYEAVGAALLTNSIITAGAFVFVIVNGIVAKGEDFWPTLTEYQLVTMFIIWVVPFLMTVLVRLFINDSRDTDDARIGFARFLSLSLRALMIIYIMVIVFNQIIPAAPDFSTNRGIYYMPFEQIRSCFDHLDQWGLLYLLWNGLILMPLTFSILVLNSRIRWWQILFISFAFGLTLEIFQFSFNTAYVYVDDVILYITGGMIGLLIKRTIDGIRSLITKGRERTMLSLDYTPVNPETRKSEEDDSDDDTVPLFLADDDDDLDDTVDGGLSPVLNDSTLS